jgi:hypothetical protein
MMYDLWFEGELLLGQFQRRRDEQVVGDILKLPDDDDDVQYYTVAEISDEEKRIYLIQD